MLKTKQQFVLGFIFDSKLEKVLLIKKNKGPKGVEMKNKLNGVGGRVELKEGLFDSIARETKEETGLDILENEWTWFCSLYLKFGGVYCFYAVTDNICNYQQIEDEKLEIYSLERTYLTIEGSGAPLKENLSFHYYRNYPRMANLDYLIPMALNHYKKLDPAKYFEITEKEI